MPKEVFKSLSSLYSSPTFFHFGHITNFWIFHFSVFGFDEGSFPLSLVFPSWCWSQKIPFAAFLSSIKNIVIKFWLSLKHIFNILLQISNSFGEAIYPPGAAKRMCFGEKHCCRIKNHNSVEDFNCTRPNSLHFTFTWYHMNQQFFCRGEVSQGTIPFLCITSQIHCAISRTLRLWLCYCAMTSTSNPVPGNQEFCLAPSKTMVEQVKQKKKSHSGHSLMMKTWGDIMIDLRLLLNRMSF